MIEMFGDWLVAVDSWLHCCGLPWFHNILLLWSGIGFVTFLVVGR
jgi:hypothetical protein